MLHGLHVTEWVWQSLPFNCRADLPYCSHTAISLDKLEALIAMGDVYYDPNSWSRVHSLVAIILSPISWTSSTVLGTSLITLIFTSKTHNALHWASSVYLRDHHGTHHLFGFGCCWSTSTFGKQTSQISELNVMELSWRTTAQPFHPGSTLQMQRYFLVVQLAVLWFGVDRPW